MSNEMTVTLSSPRRVVAHYDGLEMIVEQAPAEGAPEHPEPFDLFLASMSTCMGSYALSFCQKRGIDVAGIKLTQRWFRDEDRRLSRIEVVVEVGEGFPAKYHKALLRTVEQCSVKKALANPPEVAVSVSAV